MQTWTAPWWLLAVLGGLAAVGFVAVCWAAAGWAERAADWLRDRREAGDDEICARCLCSIWASEISSWPEEVSQIWLERHWCAECQIDDDLPPPLPPERTWEQMTSHQLPVVDGTRGLDSAGIVRAHEPWRVEAHLGAERERRAPWWEAEHRAAYESLGFDYPSGLLARVRELTP